MWIHVSDQALTDVLEETGSAEAVAHVEGCAACGARLDEAREGWTLARQADVPEPPPLYWEAFRRQVGRRISTDDSAGLPRRWRLVPVLAVAAALVAFASLVPVRTLRNGGVHEDIEVALPAWSALPSAEEDSGLSVIQALAATPEDLGAVAGCRGVDCLAELSDDETQALTDALRGEIEGRRL
jgi:hypothetical protein